MTSDTDAALGNSTARWSAGPPPNPDDDARPRALHSARRRARHRRHHDHARRAPADAGAKPIWAGYVGVPDTDAAAAGDQAAGGGGPSTGRDRHSQGRPLRGGLRSPGRALFNLMTPLPRDECRRCRRERSARSAGTNIIRRGEKAGLRFLCRPVRLETMYAECDMGADGHLSHLRLDPDGESEGEGGMMNNPEPGAPSAWLFYFWVDGYRRRRRAGSKGWRPGDDGPDGGARRQLGASRPTTRRARSSRLVAALRMTTCRRSRPACGSTAVREEAANFYISLLPDSRIRNGQRSPADNPSHVRRRRARRRVHARGTGLHGPERRPAFPIQRGGVLRHRTARTQAEVDRLWDALTADGGKEVAVRLAQGQVRPVLADHAEDAARIARRPRSRTRPPRLAGDDGAW